MQITTRTGFFLAAIFLMLLAGCGSGGKKSNDNNPPNQPNQPNNPPAQNVSIIIMPALTVSVGNTGTLMVIRQNTDDFTLSVSPASGSGCVKDGVDAVVCTPTDARTYTVTVTATADTARKADAKLTVKPPGETVGIPVIISLSDPIAGVEFEFTYTDGLEYENFEKSAAVRSAQMSPTVVKAEKTYVGFFSMNNDFVPQLGGLNTGNLVFSLSGAAGAAGASDQSVTMTEVKLSKAIYGDDGKVDNVVEIIIPGTYAVPISSSGNQEGLWIGFPQ